MINSTSCFVTVTVKDALFSLGEVWSESNWVFHHKPRSFTGLSASVTLSSLALFLRQRLLNAQEHKLNLTLLSNDLDLTKQSTMASLIGSSQTPHCQHSYKL